MQNDIVILNLIEKMMKIFLLLFSPVCFNLIVGVSSLTPCGCVHGNPPCSWLPWTQWSTCQDRCAGHHVIRTRQPCCRASRRNGSCLDQCLKICNKTVDSSFEISKPEQINKTRGTSTRGKWDNFARRDGSVFDDIVLEGPQFVLDGKLIITVSTPVPTTTTPIKPTTKLQDPNASKLSDIHSLAITGVAMGSFISLALCCCLLYFIVIKNKDRKKRRKQVQTSTPKNEDRNATVMTETNSIDF